jgi:ribonucleoside-triphosphate reductase
MRDVESINREIEQLKSELASVTGTPTEIYTRIVGYYRSLNNWNRGKREEYTKRRTFDYGDGRGGEAPHSEPATGGATAPAGAPAADTPGAAAPRPASPASGAPEPAYESRRSVAVAERPEIGTRTGVVSSYAYFFRRTCANCPPVRKLLDAAELGGDHFDVDTDEGFAKAAELQILATPTVVFFDAEGEQVGRATAARDVQGYLEFAE